ncbi:hypothetical protein CUT44_32265 [Streptomyces carminius]|uniref:Uncharacterized protein n=1 Tax=Streptomyces carminius TaxID=2665496 RepID=A0A2M8LPI9_9ACTN|nr:hypothetical protein CUT44_32265 [Streptomyces carminius]
MTLGFDAGRFPPTPPACYRASWQLPGPDFHRQATTSLRTARTPLRHGVTPCPAGRTRKPHWATPSAPPATTPTIHPLQPSSADVAVSVAVKRVRSPARTQLTGLHGSPIALRSPCPALPQALHAGLHSAHASMTMLGCNEPDA